MKEKAIVCSYLRNPKKAILNMLRAAKISSFSQISAHFYTLNTTVFSNLLQQNLKDLMTRHTKSCILPLLLLLALLPSLQAFTCNNPYIFYESSKQCIFYSNTQKGTCASFNLTCCSWVERQHSSFIRNFDADWSRCHSTCCVGRKINTYSPSWDSVFSCQEGIFEQSESQTQQNKIKAQQNKISTQQDKIKTLQKQQQNLKVLFFCCLSVFSTLILLGFKSGILTICK